MCRQRFTGERSQEGHYKQVRKAHWACSVLPTRPQWAPGGPLELECPFRAVPNWSRGPGLFLPAAARYWQKWPPSGRGCDPRQGGSLWLWAVARESHNGVLSHRHFQSQEWDVSPEEGSRSCSRVSAAPTSGRGTPSPRLPPS